MSLKVVIRAHMDVRVVLERIVAVIVLLGLALRIALEVALDADFGQSVGQ